jgi:hypothetical protein
MSRSRLIVLLILLQLSACSGSLAADTATFKQLKREGLIAALVAAVTEHGTGHTSVVRHLPPASSTDDKRVNAKNSEAVLRQKQQDRKELEKLLNVPAH